MLYDISGEHPVALGQVSCSSGMPGVPSTQILSGLLTAAGCSHLDRKDH